MGNMIDEKLHVDNCECIQCQKFKISNYRPGQNIYDPKQNSLVWKDAPTYTTGGDLVDSK